MYLAVKCGVRCELAKQSVCMQCDNLSVVAAIKKGAARDSTVMHLFWVPLVFVAHYDILLIPEHIPTRYFKYDCRSSVKMPDASFVFLHNPQELSTPSEIHPVVLKMLNLQGVDWTSPHFHELFFAITKEA